MAFRDLLKSQGLRTLGDGSGPRGAAISVPVGPEEPVVLDLEPTEILTKAEAQNALQRARAGSLPDTSDVSGVDDPKSMFWDPFSIIEQLGYKERPSSITYGTLKAIVYRMPIVQAVILTRVAQVASFAQPQQDRYQLGFQLKLRDQDGKPSKADEKWMADMEHMLMHTGVCDDPRKRDNFEQFLRKLIWDSLVYDQCGFEVVPDRRGKPAQWYAVDGQSLRLADTASAYMKKRFENDTKYVQIYDGMIVTEYNNEELCFGVRNPRTDQRLYGYGVSELEMLISAITSLLWSWQYNSKFFSQGSAAKGILNFKGAIPENQLKAFRRHWYMMLSGVENSWRTPIVNSEDLQWVNMQTTNRDMEFNAWMDFLIKVVCSCYQMDPVEVNFKYGNVGQRSGLQEAANKEKITESKERGLRPLLRFIESMINRHVVWPLNENFVFTFVGLDAQTRDDLAKLNQQRVKTTWTVDELRAEEDLPPLKDGMGEVILDPVWMQWAQQKQAQQEGAEGEGFPEFGGRGGGGETEEESQEEEGPDFEAMMAEDEEAADSEAEEEEEYDRRKKAEAKKALAQAMSLRKAKNGNRVQRPTPNSRIIWDIEL